MVGLEESVWRGGGERGVRWSWEEKQQLDCIPRAQGATEGLEARRGQARICILRRPGNLKPSC